ncbi:hypothetical protein PH91_05600 [Salmonella enterica subsp. enterica]|nr:hypothetical protein [Salmonella enterica subsp. enterica]
MIFAKCFGISWMIFWFFVLFKMFVAAVVKGEEPFSRLLATALMWLLIAVCPILIVKLGWWLISGRPVQ